MSLKVKIVVLFLKLLTAIIFYSQMKMNGSCRLQLKFLILLPGSQDLLSFMKFFFPMMHIRAFYILIFLSSAISNEKIFNIKPQWTGKMIPNLFLKLYYTSPEIDLRPSEVCVINSPFQHCSPCRCPK